MANQLRPLSLDEILDRTVCDRVVGGGSPACAVGFFVARLGFRMLAWDALVAAGALWDGQRLPAPRLISVKRPWDNAPALESETETELSVAQHGEVTLVCRLIDDLPRALVVSPATHTLRASPGLRALGCCSDENRH
jgi:hypothetical protein